MPGSSLKRRTLKHESGSVQKVVDHRPIPPPRQNPLGLEPEQPVKVVDRHTLPHQVLGLAVSQESDSNNVLDEVIEPMTPIPDVGVDSCVVPADHRRGDAAHLCQHQWTDALRLELRPDSVEISPMRRHGTVLTADLPSSRHQWPDRLQTSACAPVSRRVAYTSVHDSAFRTRTTVTVKTIRALR